MIGLELTLVAVCCSTLVAANGLSTSYGPPAPAPAPAYGPPAYSPAPAVSFAPAPAPARVLVVPVVRAIHPIPVVPFPGAGRNIIHHVASSVAQALAPAAQVVSEANAAANNIVRSIATAKNEVASNIVRGIVSAKQELLNHITAPIIAAAPAPAPVPQTVNFSPEAYAKVAPPVGLAPPVSEYGAPAPAPAQQYGPPSF